MLMGGGFGRRGNRDVDFIIDAVLLSKEAGRPVKVMWTREDDVHNGRFRPISAHYLKAGFDCVRQARGLASPHRRRPRRGLHGSGALPDGRRQGLHRDARRRPHAATTSRTNWSSSSTATPACAPIRCAGSVSWPTGSRPSRSWTRSRASAGVDPVAYRLELLKDTPRAIKAVERVAQMADWGTQTRRPRARLRLSRLFRLAGGRHRRGVARPRQRRDQGA